MNVAINSSMVRTITRTITRKTAAICAPLLLASTLSYAAVQPIDQVIAIVDDDVVLASELTSRMQQIKTNMEKSDGQMPPDADLQREVLDLLILENLQLQMAYRAGVRISDDQLNESMARIASQNRMNLIQFKQALEADGMSYNGTREQIRKEMLLQRVQQGNVNQRVRITEQEVDNFLASEEGQSLTAPEFRLAHTLLPLTASASANEHQKAADHAAALYQKIQDGASYGDVISNSKQYALKTTDLGWRKASDLPSLLADIPTAIGKGETHPPIKSASGYHLVQLIESRGNDEVVAQTHARHILLKASAIRDEAATETEIRTLRQRVLDGEDFAELARKHSEDIGSAAEGGDLGWSSPGRLVKAFQDTMDQTAIDAVSLPFRSEFGWHILQVLERRDKDITGDMRERIARNFIHRRKYDDELQTWLQKIRDEAFVDIK